MVAIAWRKLAVAGVAGLACGKGYIWLRQYPDTVRPILYCSALSGATGVLLGFGVAAYRDLPSHVYVLSTGANFAIVTAAFLGIRHVILTPLGAKSHDLGPASSLTMTQAEFVSSGASGGLSIAMATILSRRGARSVLLSSCVGVCLGLLSQLLYNQFERWRKRRGIKIHYPELVGKNEKKSEKKWTMEKFEARFMGFWHQRSKAIQADTDITLLTEAIKDEQRKIKHLDQLLRDKGVNPVISSRTELVKDRAGEDTVDSAASSALKLPHTR